MRRFWQVMYLDKPMKEHNLLQAICRVNRPYPNKTHGLIVDYLGVFDDVARALDFDEKAVQKVITNIDNLKSELPAAVAKCLGYFPGVDRSIAGYEGLLAAQECLPTNDVRDAFALDFSYLSNLWEALSPDPCLGPYAGDYRWLTQVYESVKPPSGTGKLLWAALGAKTVELIHQNVHVETVRDDLETLVMDEETLENFLSSKDPKNTVEIEFRISSRLRRLKNHPKFIELSKRLEDLKARHEKGLLTSIEFLKQLLALAKDVVAAEKETPPEEAEDPRQGRAYGSIQRDPQRRHARGGGADSGRHRRHRQGGPISRLAADDCWRARSPKGPEKDLAQIPASPRAGTV